MIFSSTKQIKIIYRVFHHLINLGWVHFDFGTSAFCPILLWLMGFQQKLQSNLARQSKSTQVRELMEHFVNLS